MAAASMKRAGNVSDIEARAMVTLPSSSGCQCNNSKNRDSGGLVMELLRQFRFDRLEGIATEMLSEGMDLQEVTETFVEYLESDDATRDGWKQKGWMTLVDGFYRNAIRAVEIGNLYERDFFLSEAWKIMLPRHGMM
jgi:hypothetical protein